MPHSKRPTENNTVGFALEKIDTGNLADALRTSQAANNVRHLQDFLVARLYAGMLGVRVDPAILSTSPDDPSLKTHIAKYSHLVRWETPPSILL